MLLPQTQTTSPSSVAFEFAAGARPVMNVPTHIKRDLVARLKREQFIPEQGRDEQDQAYRRGWNARAQSLIVDLQLDVTDVEVHDP